MNNVRIGKLSYIRRLAAASLTVSLAVLTPFVSFADVISDSPVFGAETAVSGGSSSAPVISDAPMMLEPETKAVTEIVVIESTAAQSVSAPLETKEAKIEETLPVLNVEPETKAAEAETKAAQTETAAIAELPSLGTSEVTVSESTVLSIVSVPVIESSAVANASAPQVRNVSSEEAGTSHANDSVTRIYLDFSLITPNHKYGSANVARASVKLSDGSWQKFEYKENVRYPFYRMTRQANDSDGDSCYVAAVRARKFGDSTTDDGEMKNELYLKASDCIVRDYLDISTTNQTRIAIVKAALSMLGKQYTYGGNGPDAFDCSGLVKAVMAQAGIAVPRTSTQLLSMSGQISASELRPGDIMARAGHCGIYIGNGILIHASDSSVGVIAEYLSVYNQVNKFTNCINVVGD